MKKSRIETLVKARLEGIGNEKHRITERIVTSQSNLSRNQDYLDALEKEEEELRQEFLNL